MVKKRELMEFIDKVEHKAVESVQDRYEKLIDAEKIKILTDQGYMDRIIKIQREVNKLFTESQNLVLDMKEDVTVRYEEYYNVAYRLNQFTGKKEILNDVLREGKFDGGSVEKIRTERDKEIKDVKANYHKVRVVCQDMANGAKVAEYLKGLGFDISSLEKEESTALMCEIDKSKLFVCGENK